MTEPSRWARALIAADLNPTLDLDSYVGQRVETYTFTQVDNATGYRRTLHPYRDVVPTLSHDVNRTIKRQISGLYLGIEDTANFNTITSRIEVGAVIGGQTFNIGTYMPNNQMRMVFTSGMESAPSFYDEGFIVDQESTQSFGSTEISTASGAPVEDTLKRFLDPLPISYFIEPSDLATLLSWPMGTRGGYIVEQLAIDGDWFSPWFDHQNVMRFIRSFDPALVTPTFDFDAGNKVLRANIVRSDDLITAPNRFVVISNGASAVGTQATEVVGTYDIPASAPHSIQNRGFVIQNTSRRQLSSSSQAAAVARNLGQRYTVYETAELSTAADPRHDSYDVVRWQGENWLEISWTLPLVAGAEMRHVLRKAYRD